MPLVQNPVLRGFHPDPSICRAGNDFYIASSTFEWFPGVMIYHSRDLVNWNLVSKPLERLSQLNMAGNPPSGGIWAPCLTWADDKFWLIYTDVKGWTGSVPEYNDGFKDTHNYLVTAPSIEGPWSEPLYMNASGFDPSLFHDDDGRKWFVNMKWDYRPGHNSFAGIVLQEFDKEDQCLKGPVMNIFAGTEYRFTEAPHLYKKDGWYYLMTAEGGTSYTHAVTLARSRKLEGPYEIHPANPLVTAVDNLEGCRRNEAAGKSPQEYTHSGLQKAGHGSMVPWDGDEWVLAHLCGRPLPGRDNCPLGRETALQRLTWGDDGWPWPVQQNPESVVTFSGGDTEEVNKTVFRDDFDGKSWAPEWQTLRLPADDRFSLTSRSGWLELKGAESPTSRFRQTLLARRVQAFNWSAETLVDFQPGDYQQFAGLSVRYDETTQILLRISADDEGRRCLGLIAYDLGHLTLPLGDNEILLPSEGAVYLGADMKAGQIQFRWSFDGDKWQAVGSPFDGGKLSDDYMVPMGFTGMYTGLACHDLSGRLKSAWFDFFEYREF